MLSSTPRRVAAVALAVALATLSCKSKSSPAQKVSAPDPLTGGALVFEDDFERADLGDDWKNASGKWRIDGGRVTVSNDHNEGLWLLRQLPDRARVEFRARSDSPHGDLKCEISAREPRHQGGYVVIFGGWKNQLDVIARLDEHGDDRLEAESRKVQPGHDYRWVLVRDGGTLDWYLDGERVLRYRDPSPLQGGFFGFANWETPVSFDELRVYDLSL